MSKIFFLYLNGNPYLGESDETYPANCGLSNVWQSRNANHINVLITGTTEIPKALTGWRSLQSAIDRIRTRYENNLLPINDIEVIAKDEEDGVEFCQWCGRPMTIVRPGKFQCDHPRCWGEPPNEGMF